MAYEKLSTEWHLTLDGWVRGTRTSFHVVQGSVIRRPDNTVVTLEQEIYQSHPCSDEDESWNYIWTNETMGRIEIAELYKKYGSRPIE